MTVLYYVIGASGAGKDSIMNYARSRLGAEDRVVFAHRYITRPADAGGENHIALSEEEFERRRQLGLFSMNWDSHGCRYGLGIELRAWLENGVDVVMNGSRGYLPQAMQAFPNLRPILITVSPEALHLRLKARGRESADEIERRIQRSQEVGSDCPTAIRISNDGPLEEGGECFLNQLRAVASLGI